MTKFFALPAAALSLALMTAAPQQAFAAGCIKGALVGAAAGYAAGHTILGAAGGCVAGRALAKKQQADRLRQQQEQRARRLPPASSQGQTTRAPQGQMVNQEYYGRNQPGGPVTRNSVWGQTQTAR